MIINIPCILDPNDEERAILHFAWKINNITTGIAFRYIDSGRLIDNINFTAPVDCINYDHPAGWFSVVSSDELEKLNIQNNQTLESFPLCNSEITLHTVVDRIDSIELFKKWLSHYKNMGINACSICVNSTSEKNTILLKYIDSVVSEYFAKTFVYESKLKHRYKPKNCTEQMKTSWATANPGNFHHLQHILMHLVTQIVNSQYYLFVDVDEFICLTDRKNTLLETLKRLGCDCAYFETKWGFYVEDKLSAKPSNLVLDLQSTESYPTRSKYCIKRNSAKYLNIHTPVFEKPCIPRIEKAGEILHLYNLSSYSSRSKLLRYTREELGISLSNNYFFDEI